MRHRLRELIRYRELVRNLAARDLRARYRNSVLGFLWCLMNPLLMMAVFSFVFTVMLPNMSLPRYPVFFLTGILAWNFFTTSLMASLNSVIANGHLVRKVYFPLEVLPLSAVLANLVNFLLSLIVLFLFILIFRVGLNIWIILLPFIILTQVIFTLGIGMILATMNVFYRDTAVIMEVVLLAWMFLTPVFYPIDVLPHHREFLGLDLDIHRLTYILNPMASVIAAYRNVLYGSIQGGPPGLPALDFLTRTLLTSLAFLALGYAIFCHYSQRFGEEV